MSRFIYKLNLGVMVLVLSAKGALAQRGAESAEAIVRGGAGLQGAPGYFDAHTADRGEIVIDFPPALGVAPLPMAFVDLGVTDKITVGTNAVMDLLPLLQGGVGLSAKLRALVYGDDRFQSAFTIYGGYAQFGSNEDSGESQDEEGDTEAKNSKIYFHYEHITNNTSWYILPELAVTSHLAFFHLEMQANDPKDLNYFAIDMTAIFGGISLEHTLTHRWGYRVAGIYPLYQELNADSPGVALQIQTGSSLDPDTAIFRMARASAYFKATERWTFEWGLVHLPPITEGSLWFGTTVKI